MRYKSTAWDTSPVHEIQIQCMRYKSSAWYTSQEHEIQVKSMRYKSSAWDTSQEHEIQVQSSLTYPDLTYPEYSSIRTHVREPIFYYIIFINYPEIQLPDPDSNFLLQNVFFPSNLYHLSGQQISEISKCFAKRTINFTRTHLLKKQKPLNSTFVSGYKSPNFINVH